MSFVKNFLNLFRTTRLKLDSKNPFQIGENLDIEDLDTQHLDRIRHELDLEGRVSNHHLDRFIKDELDRQESLKWVENKALGNINGIGTRFRRPLSHGGDYKQGYVGEDKQLFVQVPKKGETFEEKLERVYTWKKNKEKLDQADQYIDQILDNQGIKTVFRSNEPLEIDYRYLNNNEDILKDEITGGIPTPSENYEILITEQDEQPIPVLLGEYNQEMIEDHRELSSRENYEDILERQKTVAMYIEGLIEEGLFENAFEEYWYGRQNGPEGIKNMFYQPEDDIVGVTDIGEKRSRGTPENMPDITVPRKYA